MRFGGLESVVEKSAERDLRIRGMSGPRKYLATFDSIPSGYGPAKYCYFMVSHKYMGVSWLAPYCKVQDTPEVFRLSGRIVVYRILTMMRQISHNIDRMITTSKARMVGLQT